MLHLFGVMIPNDEFPDGHKTRLVSTDDPESIEKWVCALTAHPQYDEYHRATEATGQIDRYDPTTKTWTKISQ